MNTNSSDGTEPKGLWPFPVYARFLGEVDPYADSSLFRPLGQSYTGEKTYWRTPSPEPNLSPAFWNTLPTYFGDEEVKQAAQILAASLLADGREPRHIVFAAILRAGVPVADWLCRLLPGARAGALSLFTGLGIDRRALKALEEDHPDREVIFVDGWTGRGGVARELQGQGLRPLAVLIDPWNVADFAGTSEDILCHSACFTGPATLGFSRTFFIDEGQIFGAYVFPREYRRPDVVRAWQATCPPPTNAAGGRQKRRRFHADTDLRVHGNEVCRALINALPGAIYFADTAAKASADFGLLLELAERRKVPAHFSQKFLNEYQTRVACSIVTTAK
jgi:Phosphoribosyl transferase (PRTase)